MTEQRSLAIKGLGVVRGDRMIIIGEPTPYCVLAPYPPERVHSWICTITGFGFPFHGWGRTPEQARWAAEFFAAELETSPAYLAARIAWRPGSLGEVAPAWVPRL